MAEVRMVVKPNYFENRSKRLKGIVIETEIAQVFFAQSKGLRLT